MLRNLLGYLPTSVVKSLDGTIFDDAYKYAMMWDEDFIHIPFETPAGPVDVVMTAPESRIYDKNGANQHEPLLSKRLCERLTQESVFYDIGSHWGYYSSLAHKCGVPDKKIYSFEYDLLSYYCTKMTHETEDVHTERLRVTDSSSNPLFGVKSTSLDCYTRSNTPPSILKMDIQGAEFNAIRGARSVLHSQHPELFIEVHPHFLPKFGHSDDEIFRILGSMGYSITYGIKNEWTNSPSDIPEEDGYYIHAY